jgi:hypothetical protein
VRELPKTATAELRKLPNGAKSQTAQKPGSAEAEERKSQTAQKPGNATAKRRNFRRYCRQAVAPSGTRDLRPLRC